MNLIEVKVKVKHGVNFVKRSGFSLIWIVIRIVSLFLVAGQLEDKANMIVGAKKGMEEDEWDQ